MRRIREARRTVSQRSLLAVHPIFSSSWTASSLPWETRLPLLRVVPIINVTSHLVLRDSITLLDLALQLLPMTIYDVDIIVRQFTPLLPYLTLDLLPIPFHAIPIHNCRLLFMAR